MNGNRPQGRGYFRSYWQQLRRDGRCVSCREPRGQDGTSWRCRMCADEQRNRREIGCRRGEIKSLEPIERFVERRLGRYIDELARHVENIYEVRDLWTRERIMHEGNLEVRR